MNISAHPLIAIYSNLRQSIAINGEVCIDCHTLPLGGRGRTRKAPLRHPPFAIPCPSHDHGIDLLSRHQRARCHSLGENGPGKRALCHICASEKVPSEVLENPNIRIINELST